MRDYLPDVPITRFASLAPISPNEVFGKTATFVNHHGHVLARGKVIAWTDQPAYCVEMTDGSRDMVLAKFLTSYEVEYQARHRASETNEGTE